MSVPLNNSYQPLHLSLKDWTEDDMSTTQLYTASAMAGGQELGFPRKIESPFSADLGFFLDSAETQRLVQELMSDASLLAQVNGLMSEVDGKVSTDSPRLVSSTPIPGSEDPEATRQKPGSTMEAHAPLTPTVVPTTMRQETSHIHLPTDTANYSQHQVQGGHPYPPSVLQTPPQYNQCQAPPPPKKGFLGNKRKPKTNFTNEQLELLEMTFAHSHYPSSVLRNQLAYASGLPLKAVQTWFQNRRVRFKRKYGKITKQSRQSPTSDSGSSWLSQSVTASPSSEYLLVFPPLVSGQQAGQFVRDGPQHQQKSLSSYEDVTCGYKFHPQLASRPFPDQTATSRDWYQRQQLMGVPPHRQGAVSPWALTNAGCPQPLRPSNENLLMRGGHNLDQISLNLSEPSMTFNGQHPRAQTQMASPYKPPEGAMPTQYQQPYLSVNSYRPATSPCMMQDQVSFQYASPERQSSKMNWMYPQYTPYPQNIERFAAPNTSPQVSFSVVPQQELQSDVRNPQDNHSYPMPKSVTQDGYSPTETSFPYHHSNLHLHQQTSLPSFSSTHSRTSSQTYSECPTSFDSPPCSSPDEEPLTRPTDIQSVAQGTSTLNNATPTVQRQFLPPAKPPFSPVAAVALYSDSQHYGQFPTQPQATPRNLFRACDNPVMSPAAEPLESPSTPLSTSSFGSCKTLYIDLDAEIV